MWQKALPKKSAFPEAAAAAAVKLATQAMAAMPPQSQPQPQPQPAAAVVTTLLAATATATTTPAARAMRRSGSAGGAVAPVLGPAEAPLSASEAAFGSLVFPDSVGPRSHAAAGGSFPDASTTPEASSTPAAASGHRRTPSWMGSVTHSPFIAWGERSVQFPCGCVGGCHAQRRKSAVEWGSWMG